MLQLAARLFPNVIEQVSAVVAKPEPKEDVDPRTRVTRAVGAVDPLEPPTPEMNAFRFAALQLDGTSSTVFVVE